MEKNSRMSKCKKLRDKIGKFVVKLKQTTFYQTEFTANLEECLKYLGNRKIGQIICYGLGSFCDGVDMAPRYQLALLLLVHEYLAVASDLSPIIEIYDPSFVQMDKETLLTFTRPRFHLIEKNEHCARELTIAEPGRCAMIYMPHLDKYLYNNLLGVNWTSDKLIKLVILGNSFQEMVDNERQIICKTQLYYLDTIVNNKGVLVELSVDDSSFEHLDIFNSLSFHLVDEDWIVNNSIIIERSRLPNWTYVTNGQIDEWSD